ncbi:MAG: glycosyltransferase family 2 protein [Anaerostipes sp.]|jgi:glycosyltransferase involved in cell wall biosynthesis|nr:glycosyltransferase family 2 protein [Anaerostipes sp.]
MISIIIPTYNRRMYLQQMLESILEQTYQEIEIIVIDDNSTDETKAYMKDCISNYKNIRYIQNTENKGAGYNRRIGYLNSSGEYIIFADDDDYYIDNTFFEKTISCYEKNHDKNLSFVSGNVKILDEASGEFKQTNLGISGFMERRKYLESFQVNYQKPYSTFTTIFKRSKLEESHFKDVEMVNDSTIYLRALLCGNGYILTDIIGIYRVHEVNISKNLDVEFLIDNLEEKRRISEIIKKNEYIFNADEWWMNQFKMTIEYFISFSKVNMSDFEKIEQWVLSKQKKGKIKLRILLKHYKKISRKIQINNNH